MGPLWAQLLNRKALASIGRGALREAAVLLERAVQEDPNASDPVYNLACALALLGDLDGAEAELQWALAMDPLRYQRLAKEDPDLAVLLARPGLADRLGLED